MRRSSFMKSIRWCFICVFISTTICSNTESNASEVTGIVAGTDEYMRLLHLEPDYVLVGAKNMLYNISTVTMEVQASYKWTASSTHLQGCHLYIQYYQRDCESYIRSVRKEDESTFIVCASSAKTASCKPLSLGADGWVMGDWMQLETNMAYAPIFPWEEIVVYRTTENTVYSATHYQAAVQTPAHILFRDSFTHADGAVMNSMSSSQTMAAINSDKPVGLQPKFVKIFETVEHVYLLFSEPALETYAIQKAVYSRVARVCKNDRGNPVVGNNFELVTFFKTRLLCGIPEIRLDAISSLNDTTGRYSYYFNELADSSDLHMDTVSGERVLIAAFNSPRNSMAGSAICMYRVSDLEKVFDSSPAIFQNGHSGEGYEHGVRPIRSRPPAKCPDNTNNLTSEEIEDSKHPLLKNPVTAINNATLYIQTGADYKITQVAVDWNVEGPDGKNRTVIFTATDDGKLLKLVSFQAEGDKEARYHMVEERQVFPGKTIQEMRLITDSSHKKHLLLSTFDSIKRVAVEKCHRHTTCSQCIGVRDPYCSWSVSHETCVSTSHSASEKYQSVETGQHDVCDTVTTPNTPVDKDSDDVEGDDKNEVPTGKSPVGASQRQPNSKWQNVLIALTVSLPIMCLIGGFAAGFIYHRYRSNRSNTSHLDELSERKHKKMIDRSDSDTYQEMPKLHIHNNFTAKSNNALGKSPDTTTPVGPGESTLARTKKSYV